MAAAPQPRIPRPTAGVKFPTMSVPAPHLWLHHYADEADAAHVYRALAIVEPDPRRSEIFLKLAGVEERHVELWARLLTETGHPIPSHRPSLRARWMVWMARKFGVGSVLPMMLEEEGREVKGYLNMYRQSSGGAEGETALTLAKESAQHAAIAGRALGRLGRAVAQDRGGRLSPQRGVRVQRRAHRQFRAGGGHAGRPGKPRRHQSRRGGGRPGRDGGRRALDGLRRGTSRPRANARSSSTKSRWKRRRSG